MRGGIRKNNENKYQHHQKHIRLPRIADASSILALKIKRYMHDFLVFRLENKNVTHVLFIHLLTMI